MVIKIDLSSQKALGFVRTERAIPRANGLGIELTVPKRHPAPPQPIPIL